MNDEMHGPRRERKAWQRSQSQRPWRSFLGPFEQEDVLVEAEQDDLRHTEASSGLETATAVSAGGTNGGL